MHPSSFSVRRLILASIATLVVLGYGTPVRLRGQAFPDTPVPAGTYVFTTYAGFTAPPGNVQLDKPMGIARDSAGNLYFSDSENHVIRKLAADGTLSVVAGQPGISGTADGPIATAGFWLPAGLAIDDTGNLYVGDAGTRRIRMISTAGVVSTIAGEASVLEPVDGVGTEAHFGSVDHLTIDGAGNLYVTDSRSHVIRKVSLATQQVTTIAGRTGVAGTADGVGTAAEFGRPQGIAADSAGNLLIVDHDGHTLRKMVLATGLVSTLAGSPGVQGAADGVGSEARFDYPTAVAVDSAGNAYVSNWINHTIRRVTPAGVVTTVAGVANAHGSADGPLGLGLLNLPQGIVVDPSGTMFIADWGNNLIRKVTAAGMMSTIVGAPSAGSADGYALNARFDSPVAPAVDPSGNVYVIDRGNYTIRKIAPDGLVTTFAYVGFASGLAVDSVGNLYVARDNHVIVKITSTGEHSTLAGSAGVRGSADGVGSDARFNQPSALAVDQAGNIFVTDSVNYTVRKIAPGNIVTTIAGKAGEQGFIDGTGASARFGWPAGVAVTSAGTIYVADSWYGTIRRISPSGVVTTLAGAPGQPRIADGVGSSAAFFAPNSVALDPEGNLLVTEGVGMIRKVTPSGVVTTIGGLPHLTGMVNGVGTAARFENPRGVAVDASGTAYVADMSNNVIRRAQNRPPVISVHPVARTVLTGTNVTFTAGATGNGPLHYQWYKNGVAIEGATAESLDLPSVSAESAGGYYVRVSNTVAAAQSNSVALSIHVPPSITTAPASATVEIGSSVALQVQAAGTPAPTYQWRRNGSAIAGATSPTLTLTDFTYADAGAFDVVVSNSAGTVTSSAAVLGIAATGKTGGAAYEFAANIVHPNGTTYDQVLLTGSAATITADPGQVTRMSLLDLNDDIYQIEFSGQGTLTVTLENASGPALPVKYNQDVSYTRGHASIVISGANETTHLSIFSVGQLTAPNSSLYRPLYYDGLADLALVMIGTTNGKFGGLRMANGSFFARHGLTGISAPGVTFVGPVFVGSLNAFETATPTLLLGACDDVRIAGSSLLQSNGRAVQVSGITQLKFVAGTNSHGVLRPAQPNQARLEENGKDVTAEIVVNPP